MCCGKAGVSNQLCGWLRGIKIMTGRMEDSGLMQTSKVLEKQAEFTKEDKSSKEPCLNVFDKGFRNVVDARRFGQRCLQPVFARSDEQFTGGEVLYSAAVAVVCSGNERAVQRSKMSWFIKHGRAYTKWDIELICDVWEAWTFQVNFMYCNFL